MASGDYSRDRYLRNRDKILARVKAYQAEHAAEISARKSARRRNNQGQFQRMDRAAYLSGRRRRQAIINQAKSSGCFKCGETHVGCLDFHHRNPADKLKSIAKLATSGDMHTLAREIKKCDILCANCHRKLHWEARNASNG